MLKLELVRLGKNCPTSKTPRRVGKFQARKVSRLASTIEKGTPSSSKRVQSPPNLEHRESEMSKSASARIDANPRKRDSSRKGMRGNFQAPKTAQVENERHGVVELLELDPIPDRDLKHLGAHRQETDPSKCSKTPSFATTVKTSEMQRSSMSKSTNFERSKTQKFTVLKEGPVQPESFADRVQPYTATASAARWATPRR